MLEAQGFYCQNGPEVDGEYNVVMPDGKIGPGASARHPFYFFPEPGFSSGTWYKDRTTALREVRNRLERERDRVIERLGAINNELGDPSA